MMAFLSQWISVWLRRVSSGLLFLAYSYTAPVFAETMIAENLELDPEVEADQAERELESQQSLDVLSSGSRLDPTVMESFSRLISAFELEDVSDAESLFSPESFLRQAGVPEAIGSAVDIGAELRDDMLKRAQEYPQGLETAARFFKRRGQFSAAIRAYVDILNHIDSNEEVQKRALIGLAGIYYESGSATRAISLLEKYLRHFPQDERRPEILFQIGLLFREMGLHRESVSTFYRVLNAIVVTREASLQRYVNLARRAQFEIARSHFNSAEWAQALQLFARIDLFELSAVDRETIRFYQTQATFKSGDLKGALQLARAFVQKYPGSPLAPQMLYTKAEIQHQLHMTEDAMLTLMRLLEQSRPVGNEHAAEWNHWRQVAGNRFANRFYESQDFLAALRIYQGLVALSDDSQWQIPIVYQIGLSFERLGMFERALESYQFVISGIDRLGAESDQPLGPGLQQLRRNAVWRVDMLEWRSDLNQRLQSLTTTN